MDKLKHLIFPHLHLNSYELSASNTTEAMFLGLVYRVLKFCLNTFLIAWHCAHSRSCYDLQSRISKVEASPKFYFPRVKNEISNFEADIKSQFKETEIKHWRSSGVCSSSLKSTLPLQGSEASPSSSSSCTRTRRSRLPPGKGTQTQQWLWQSCLCRHLGHHRRQ